MQWNRKVIRKISLVILIIVFSSFQVSRVAAQERTEDNNASSRDSGNTFLVVELSLALVSWGASESPKGVGGLLVLASPFSLDATEHSTVEERYVAFGGLIGVGLLNILVLSDDSHSSSERFIYNEVALHGLLLAEKLTHHWTKDEAKGMGNGIHVGVGIYEDTPLLVLQYKY